MDKFTTLTGVAAPLLNPNVSTDVLIRIERMIVPGRGQLGRWCFEAWRYRADGSVDPDFVLNAAAYANAAILVAGANFGCGSSREPAVWALWDMGFRCVIAPSFGDIFYNNCFQNGLLPINLPPDLVASLMREAESAAPFTVDLQTQRVLPPSGREVPFGIDAAKRRALLDGQDEITMTLAREHEIAAFQQRDGGSRPWVYQF